MSHLKWVIGFGSALVLLPMAAAFLFPPRPVPPPPPRPDTSLQLMARLPSVPSNNLSGVARRAGKGWVTLRADTHWDTPGQAIHTFLAALKTYPQTRRVRVSWSLLVFMNSTNTTVLYDRRSQTLSFYSVGSGDLGTSHDHVRYAGVPEAVFVKLADMHRDDRDETSGGGFEDLPKYGCRKRDLGSWMKDAPG